MLPHHPSASGAPAAPRHTPAGETGGHGDPRRAPGNDEQPLHLDQARALAAALQDPHERLAPLARRYGLTAYRLTRTLLAHGLTIPARANNGAPSKLTSEELAAAHVAVLRPGGTLAAAGRPHSITGAALGRLMRRRGFVLPARRRRA